MKTDDGTGVSGWHLELGHDSEDEESDKETSCLDPSRAKAGIRWVNVLQ
jgi:hypothetical protein